MTKVINPNDAVEAIYNLGKFYAQAKADRVHLEQFRKSKKALLIQEAPDGTIQAKESYAYAHDDYILLLEGLKAAVEKEETYKYKIKAAELRVEVWRTEQANARSIEKGLSTFRNVT